MSKTQHRGQFTSGGAENLLLTEASDLGWKPGEWPDSFLMEELGQDLTFTLRGNYVVNGSYIGKVYDNHYPGGKIRETVIVYND